MGEPRLDCIDLEKGVTTIMSTNYEDRISELEKENKKLKDELAYYKELASTHKRDLAALNGEINGLRFAIRANGISGADVY